MYLLFKDYSLVKVIYLLIRCYKTMFFQWNTNNTEKMVQINKIHTQNTQRKIKIEGLVSMKRSDTSPFLKQPHLFYQPLHFYGRNLKTAPFFSEISKTQSPPLQWGRGSNYALAFSLKKLNIHHTICWDTCNCICMQNHYIFTFGFVIIVHFL